MAVGIENLIDLNLLARYDSNMKGWVQGQISNFIHAGEGELPEKGEAGVIYVKETSLYLWNGEEYQEIKPTAQWVDF